MKVTKQNYEKYKYLDDYRNGALEKLSDEELEAQKFHLVDIYKRVKPPLSALKKIAMHSLMLEKRRRENDHRGSTKEGNY